MIKETNTRDKVTLSKEQSKELAELGKKYNLSKSALIGFAVSALLSYKAGEAIGEWLMVRLEDALSKDKESPTRP